MVKEQTNKIIKKKMNEGAIKVISADAGLAEGTVLKYDPEKKVYYFSEENTEVGDGYEYTTTAKTTFSRAYVEDNIGVLFVDATTKTPTVEDKKEEIKIATRQELWELADKHLSKVYELFERFEKNLFRF
jgi:hypothetical protein